MKDSDTQPQPSNTATAPQRRELAFKTIGNTRANRRGKAGTELLRPNPRLDSGPPETDDAQRQRQSPDLAADMNQKETESLVGSKPLTRARSLRGETKLQNLSPQAFSNTVERSQYLRLSLEAHLLNCSHANSETNLSSLMI